MSKKVKMKEVIIVGFDMINMATYLQHNAVT